MPIDSKYRITRELQSSRVFDKKDYKSKFRYFEGQDFSSGRYFFLANYGEYWGVGQNFYDSARDLEANMFASKREQFMKIIDSEQNSHIK